MTDQQPGTAHETRERIIHAAGPIFADRGFAAASIREICQQAEANVAAVNYYFRDKQSLYSETLRYAHLCISDQNHMRALAESPAPPAEKLGHFVRNFFENTLDPARPAWYGKLIAQEMITPTPALDDLVEHEIRPKFTILRSIVADLAGVPAEHEAVRWLAAAVIGNCLFWHNNRAVIERLYPDLEHNARTIAFLAEHVTRFSVAAIHGLRDNLDVYTAWRPA